MTEFSFIDELCLYTHFVCVFYLSWCLGVAAGGTIIILSLRNPIFCNNFSSRWYLYAVCATQYLLGFHVCGGEDPLIVAHIKQGFRGKRPKPDLICSWMWELGLWEGAVISMCLFVEAREERIPTEHSWCELRPHLQVLWVSWWRDHQKFGGVVMVGSQIFVNQ